MTSGWHWRFWEQRKDDCGRVEPLLSLYVDSMTSTAEARRVESHLPGCANCRQMLEWMQATHQVIAQRPKATPPADLRARIARAIAEAEAASAPATAPADPPPLRRPARRPLVLRPAFGYALSMALFAAVTGTLYWSGHEGGPVALAPVTHHNSTIAVRPPAQTVLPLKHSVLPALPSPSQTPHQYVSPSTRMVAVRPPAPHLRSFHSAPVLMPEPQTVAVNTVPKRLLPARIIPSVFAPSAPLHAHLSVVKVTLPTHNLLAARTRPAHTLHLVTPKTITHTPPLSGSTVAQLPPSAMTPAPEKVAVGTPTVTPDHTQVASYVAPPTLNDTLHHLVAANLSGVPLTAHRFILSSKTMVAREAADVTSSSSGTVAMTYGSFR